MRLSGLLIALSLGLLLSGIIVAVIKPRAAVSSSRGVYSIPEGEVLVYLLSPSASLSRITVDVEADPAARVIIASVNVAMLAKGAAAVFTGMLQSIGTSAVMLDSNMAGKVLGMRGVEIMASGGPGRYVVGGVDKPILLFIYRGGSSMVSLRIVRYNMLVSMIDEKRLGVTAAVIAATAILLLSRELLASR